MVTICRAALASRLIFRAVSVSCHMAIESAGPPAQQRALRTDFVSLRSIESPGLPG